MSWLLTDGAFKSSRQKVGVLRQGAALVMEDFGSVAFANTSLRGFMMNVPFSEKHWFSLADWTRQMLAQVKTTPKCLCRALQAIATRRLTTPPLRAPGRLLQALD